ncbi:hypothetical protein CRG98_043842, partial [Punica granatum]
RTSQPTQRALPPQGQQGGAAQPRPHKQYPALPVPLSHIYQQIRDKVGTTAPGPSFDPTIQDQSKRCEYHQGAPGHTVDNCWKLRAKVQEMIDAKELVFNAVRPSINMITVCTSSEGGGEQGGPSPGVIEYVPAEVAVGFAGVDAPHAPLVIDVPAREPYSNDRVPWTYEGSVGDLEQQFGVMGITRSERLYENPAATDKVKAPATEEETRPRTLPTPSKKVKFIVEEKIITVKGEEDYAIYKETAVPYFSVGDDENLPFHSFETISVIRDYGEVGSSRADRMIGKVLLRHNYIPGTGLGARRQGINRPIEVEVYKHRGGLGFHHSCHEIIEARRGNHLHRLATRYEPGPIYFGEGLDEDNLVPEIEESLRRLKDRQLTSLEPTEEINVGTEEEPRVLKIGTSLDPTQRVRMIDFLTRYQEVFAWSYADMPGLDPSIVKHFLPLDTDKFLPKRQQLRRQRASLLLRIKEEVVKQITAGFLEVCNYSEWVANIVPVEKKDGRVRVCVDYRDLNKASPKDNFPLPHIDILVDNTARHAQFSFMDGFSGYNQIRMAEEDKIKTTFTTMWGTFCYRCQHPILAHLSKR